MAYDDALAARIREHLGGEPVTEKRMVGGLAFLLGGHLAVAASGQGGLLVRCEPGETAALLTEPGVARMEMGGRAPMAADLDRHSRGRRRPRALGQARSRLRGLAAAEVRPT